MTGSSQVPGLVSEYTMTGRWLFRWRGYVPIILVVGFLIFTALSPAVLGGAAWTGAWVGLGFLFGAMGLGIRAYCVGCVPDGTSGRGTKEMCATVLNTTGAYSLVRHPLYAGNLLLWLGVAAFVGRPMVLVVTVLVFWLYYERIMIAEEAFLGRKFGDDFRRWAEETPAFLPLVGNWRPGSHPFRLLYALGREYQATVSFVLATFSIQWVRLWSEQGTWRAASWWWAYLVFGVTVFAALRTLRRRMSWFQVSDR